MQEIACIFCGVNSNICVIEENGYNGIKCPICNLIYISPQPILSQVLDRYMQDKSSVSAESIIHDDFSKKLHAKHILKIIRKYKESGSILEIGAGAGYFLNEARNSGFDVYGIEINSVQATFINKVFDIPCESNPLNKSSFQGKEFDIIYHCNVLSHLYEPISEFKKINERLKENGIHIFETGNLGDVRNNYLKLFEKFDYPDHLFFFSKKSLHLLMKLTQFQVIRMYEYSIVPQLSINKMLNKVRKVGKNQNTLSKFANARKENQSHTDIQSFSLRQILKNARVLISHIMTYSVGNSLPKKNKPQTLIIVGEKVQKSILGKL